MRVKIHNRQGKGLELKIPLRDMVTSLAEQMGDDKATFVRKFNALSLEEQLAMADTEEVPREMVTAFRDERLLPGTLAKLGGKGEHGTHGCEIASGTHYTRNTDYFFIGDRQLYFELRLDNAISVRIEEKEDGIQHVVRGKGKSNIGVTLTPRLATLGGVYVNVFTFQAAVVNFQPRTVKEGDIYFQRGFEGRYSFEKKEASKDEWDTNPPIFVDNPNMKHDEYTMRVLKKALKDKGLLEDG